MTLCRADFPGVDFADLQRSIQDAMLDYRRSMRLARHLSERGDMDGGIASEGRALERHALALATCSSIIARFIADEGHARPRAGVTYLRPVSAATD